MAGPQTEPTVVYDPLDYDARSDAYPLYRLMRDEFPVYYNPQRQIWALTRFDDVQAASRDWETFSNVPGTDIDDFHEVTGPGDFLSLDPPRHDELRDVVRRHFAPSAMVKCEPEMAAVVDSLLDGLIERETVDLAADFAMQLPVAMMAAIIGFPAADRERLVALVHDFGYRESGQSAVPARCRAAARELHSYFGDLVAVPAEHPSGCVVSGLAAAVTAGTVTSEEAANICGGLFLAGIETTAALISNALKILSECPDKATFLRENPQIMPRAIEEFLRYESPVPQTARTATRSVAIHDTEIPAGARVVLVYAAANRDERRFPNPDVLDFGREVKRMLAFGEGVHFCMGAPLARPEARIALSRFLARVSAFELCGEPQWMPTHVVRGYGHLPATLRPARR